MALNKFYIFYVVFVILTYCKFNQCQLTPDTVPTILTIKDIPPQNYQGYTIGNDFNECTFQLNFIAEIDNVGDKISSLISSNGTSNLVFSEDQHTRDLYVISLPNVPMGSNIYSITVKSLLSISITYSLNVTCLNSFEDLESVSITVSNVPPTKYALRYFISPVQVKGFLVPFSLGMGIGAINNNSYIVIWQPMVFESNLSANWTIDFNIKTRNFSLSIESPYKDEAIEEIQNIKVYPEYNGTPIEPNGAGYSPLITFISPSMSNDPFLAVKTPNSGVMVPRPISGKQGSIKYITYFYDYFENYNPINYSLCYQNGSTTSSVKIVSDITKLKVPLFPRVNNITTNFDPEFPFFTVEFNISNKFNSYDINYSNDLSGYIQIQKSFPFAFKSGNNLDFTFSVSFPVKVKCSSTSNSMTIGTGGYGIGTSVNFDIDSNEIVADTTPPEILSYEFIQIRGSIHLLRLQVMDNYGILLIKSPQSSTVNKYAKLVSGTIYNGIFEIFLDVMDDATVKITNNLGNSINLGNDGFYNLNPPTRFSLPSYSNSKFINFDSFKNISFLYNNVNLNNQTSYNIFYFNSTDIPINKPMYLYLNDPYTLDRTLISFKTNDFTLFPIFWNETIKMFNCKFILKKNNMFGEIRYSIYSGTSGLYIGGILDNPVSLIVNSTYLDNYGPIFKTIIKSDDIIQITSMNTIGWRFVIEDELNGFQNGYIKIMGEIDNSNYQFNFTIDDAKSGDIWNGVYDIMFNVTDPCFPQDYVITEVILYDTNNVVSEFSVHGIFPNPTANPFINYIGDLRINRIFVSCLNSIIDSTPPLLSNFTVISSSSIIDVGSLNGRSIAFNFEAYDDQTGLKELQNPIVYVSTLLLDIVSCESKLISKPTPLSAIYQCTIELEVGFGYPGTYISYSVYGLVNNGGYYGGYTSIDLKNQAFTYYSEITYSLDPVVVTNIEPITSEGGQLIIYGKGFKNITSIQIGYYDEGSSFNNSYNPSFVSFSYLVVDGIKSTTEPFIVRVSSNSQTSNEITVYPKYFNIQYSPNTTPTPTPTPTPTTSTLPTNQPQKCLGDPECGGIEQGYCNQGVGCVCNSPWIGTSCSSQVIIVPQPNTNPNEPTIEIPTITDSNKLFKSLISIVSLRELDFNQVEIKSFTFDKWILTKINDNKNQYFTNITTSPITGGSGAITTNITVTLEWFKNETVIEFASTNLTMNPSTIKYTIDITEYAFSSKLNQLQLIMSALVTSDSNDLCSVKEFGSTSSGDNSNYIKIQIDDHSLYGRFIKRAIIDSLPITITNVLLDKSFGLISSSPSSQQSLIGITIPSYKTNISLDPDFSILLDSNSISSENENSICNSSSSGLTTGQLVGIIIGSVGFFVVAVIIITYYVSQKKKDKKFLGSFKNKLKSLN